MNEARKLTMQMAIFFLIILVTFGTIIVKEKSSTLFLPKIENSLNNYIKENYNNLELVKGKITFKNNAYTMKVTNQKNKNHYFYITYSNKKITDTYQTDYIEGKSLLNHLNTSLENTIYEKTNITCTIEIINTLDMFSDKIKELLLSEKEVESLKIYTLKTEITTPWNSQSITANITDLMTNLDKKNVTPKNYTIILTDQTDITKSVKISNLTTNNLKNDNLSTIINDIINNEKTSILTENNITYEYLN